MYHIEIPDTVHQLLGIFYRLGMWTSSDTATLGEFCQKIFGFIYFVSFVLSLAIGAYTTDDKDESVFLTVTSVIAVLQTYRMWIILWRKNGFMLLVNQNGPHSTNDGKEFIQINNTLNIFMKFVRYFLIVTAIGIFYGVFVFPATNERRLMYNVAFPFDRSVIITTLIWYLMLSISLEYKILGNQLRHMGLPITTGIKVSLAAQQQLFLKDFIVAIQTYDKINGKLEAFASYLGNLFFLQTATGSVCICGSVYTLAFSSQGNLILYVFYCLVLAYCAFDIFMVMYLGNEIMLSSDELSHCVYESDWIEQTESCKKCIIILTERLKRPQEIIVAKLYPLNLLTFSSIVNGAYSMFNILQNFR